MARVGNLRWAELQVFAVVGSWVVTTPEHEARVALDAVSRHAAWRAGMLAERLPQVGALASGVVTEARNDDVVAAVEEMAAVQSTPDRLVVLGDVMLGGLVASSLALVDTLSPVADAPLLRVLPMLIDDLGRDHALVSNLMADNVVAGGPAGHAGGSIASRLALAVDAAGGW